MSNAKRTKKPNVHTQRVQIADRYFAEHPHAIHFEREVTPAECRVLGLAPGTKVGVFKIALGYAHAYAPPPAGHN